MFDPALRARACQAEVLVAHHVQQCALTAAASVPAVSIRIARRLSVETRFSAGLIQPWIRSAMLRA
jgi:hypothetical protein